MKRILTLIVALCTIFSAEAAYSVKKIKAPKGTTLCGVVYCGDEPLAGVKVSDGVNIATTDDKCHGPSVMMLARVCFPLHILTIMPIIVLNRPHRMPHITAPLILLRRQPRG